MYWLKAIGAPDANFYAGRLFNAPVQRIDFSTHPGQPNIPLGDIILVYGIGITTLLFAASPQGPAQKATRLEIAADPWRAQWPWHMNVTNLTQNFGAVWNIHHLNPFHLVDVFHVHNPDVAITNAGGLTLGALQWGRDRVRLTDQFGQFLFDQMI
ncbi:MAG: hypothetical protein HY089_10945 [Ignavibacteriales bacterium]|nr:hypothetical protein [Ignavibacteriales bacterium]